MSKKYNEITIEEECILPPVTFSKALTMGMSSLKEKKLQMGKNIY